MKQRKKLVVTGGLIAAGISLFLATQASSRVVPSAAGQQADVPPPFPASASVFPEVNGVEQTGSDALSKLLDSVGSLQNIRLSLKTVEDSVGRGAGFINSLQSAWVSANNWVQDKIGISLRSIVQFIGYLFIFVAVLWIKLVRWILSVI